MYKSKLQEFCQKRGWELPEYTTVKDGFQHMPRFTSTVNVRGQAFTIPATCKSAKEAQNTVALIALDHFNGTTTTAGSDLSLPNSQFIGVLLDDTINSQIATVNPPTTTVNPQLHGVLADVSLPIPISVASTQSVSPLPSSLPIPPPDMLNIYKNHLQEYAQKGNLGFPVYTTEAEGPPHARRFKSKVSVDGKSYEILEFFSTLREAEQAAAKVACQALSVDVIQEARGLYKNLLQEFVQKKGLLCPSYETVSSGMSHRPIFVSTVMVGSDTFQGAEAKTKKEAEMNAAKVAYCAFTKGGAVMESSKESPNKGCPVADNLSQNIQPISTTKKHLDATNEEDNLHAKRARSSPKKMNVDPPSIDLVHPTQGIPPSNGSNAFSSQVENSTSAEPVAKQRIENPPLHQWKTVVFPCKLNMPIPEDASVMPYSDDDWVAYKVKLDNQLHE